MNKKKWLILAVIVGFVGLVSYLVVSGMVRPAAKIDSKPAPVPSASSSLPPQQGIVEDATGVTADGPAYGPTPSDVIAWVKPLVEFDTKKQTYDQWHQYADEHIVYTPQDFPKDSVVPITPNRGEWGQGWKREWLAGSVEELPSFKGQGGATIYSWTVGGPQTLYGPDGEPWIGGYNDVVVAAQCAGATADTCRVLAYTSDTYPLDFQQEKALYTP